MAIQDQIARLTKAKEDFKTKLIEKGVEVTDDELISDYPPKLDLIKGGATITKSSEWIGTPVPNTGYVENAYFNTNLSVEEVVGLLSQLEYTNVNGSDSYYIFGNYDSSISNLTIGLMVSKMNNSHIIMDSNFNVIFVESSELGEMLGASFIGWNPDLINPIIYNTNVTENGIFEDSAIPFGTENDKLTSLISTTPFTQATGEQITLEGDYDGSTLVLDGLPKGGWSGTPVPNSGLVDKIYINFNLTASEIDEIVKSLSYSQIKEGSENYIVFADSYDLTMSSGNFILIDHQIGSEQYQLLASINGAVNFIGDNSQGFYEGLQTIVPNGLNYNSSNLVEAFASQLGLSLENDKLSSLFSITPFVETKPNTINVKSLIEQKKIPLEIKVNNAGGIVEVDKLPEVGNEGTLYKTYITLSPKIYLQNSAFKDMAEQVGLELPCDLKDFLLAILSAQGANGSVEYKVIKVTEGNIIEVITNPELMVIDESTMSIYMPIYYMSDEYSRSQYDGFTFISFQENSTTTDGITTTTITPFPFVHEMVAGALGLPYETDTEMFVGEVDNTDDMTADGYYVMDGGTVEALHLFEDNVYKKVALGINEDVAELIWLITDSEGRKEFDFGTFVNAIQGLNYIYEYYLVNDLNGKLNVSTGNIIYVYIYDQDTAGKYLYVNNGESTIGLFEYLNISGGYESVYKGVVTNTSDKEDGIYAVKATEVFFYSEGELITPIGTLEIKETGKFDVTKYKTVVANISLQEKTVTTSGEVLPDEGYYGLSKVTVDAISKSEVVELKVNVDTATALDFRFMNMPNLKKLDLSNMSFFNVPTGALYNCNKLEELISPHVDASSVSSAYFGNMFADPNNEYAKEPYEYVPTSLHTVEISYSTSPYNKYLNEYTFYKCSNIKNIIFTTELNTIGKSCFEGCTSLISLSPFYGSLVHEYAFKDCTSLTKIELLYEGAAGQVGLGTGAFKGCTNLETIVTSSKTPFQNFDSSVFEDCINLVNIDTSYCWYFSENVFKNCTKLNNIILNDIMFEAYSYAKIFENAFYGCTGLTDVYFTGTETQWNNLISEGKIVSTGNECLLNATIHFNHVITKE